MSKKHRTRRAQSLVAELEAKGITPGEHLAAVYKEGGYEGLLKFAEAHFDIAVLGCLELRDAWGEGRLREYLR